MKPNKHQLKALKSLAVKINKMSIDKHGKRITYSVSTYQKVSKEDMQLANQNVDEGNDYLIKIHMVLEVNHFRRLKKAFSANGVDGVLAHLRRCQLTTDKNILSSELYRPH